MKILILSTLATLSSSVAFGADDNSLGGLFKKLIDKAAQAQSAQQPAAATPTTLPTTQPAAPPSTYVDPDPAHAALCHQQGWDAAFCEREARDLARQAAEKQAQAQEQAEAEQERQQERLANCNDLRNHTGQYVPATPETSEQIAKGNQELIEDEMADLMMNRGLDEATARQIATNKIAGLRLKEKQMGRMIDDQLAMQRREALDTCAKEFGS